MRRGRASPCSPRPRSPDLARANHPPILNGRWHGGLCVVSALSTIPQARRSAMRYYSFQIVIEKEPEDAGYYAYSPTLPGCLSNGKTIEEARRNIREAIEQHVESLRARSQAIPQSDSIVHVEELSIGLPA